VLVYGWWGVIVAMLPGEITVEQADEDQRLALARSLPWTRRAGEGR
jgi:hypothetical protein